MLLCRTITNKEVFMKYYTKPELNKISLAQTENLSAFMGFEDFESISASSPITSWNATSGAEI